MLKYYCNTCQHMCCFVLKSISGCLYEKNLKNTCVISTQMIPKFSWCLLLPQLPLPPLSVELPGWPDPPSVLRSQLASLPFLSNKLKGPFWPLAEPCITREDSSLVVSYSLHWEQHDRQDFDGWTRLLKRKR